jgi:hypothetical protein
MHSKWWSANCSTLQSLFLQGKNPRNILDRGLGMDKNPRAGVGCDGIEKNICPDGNLNPVASHYTDFGIRKEHK